MKFLSFDANVLITTPHSVVPNLYYPHIFTTYQFHIINPYR